MRPDRDQGLGAWAALEGVWVTLGVSAVLGCLSASRLGPALLVWGVWQGLVRPRLRLVLLSLLVFVCCSSRAGDRLRAFIHDRARVRDELGAPQRCAVRGTIDASPVFRTSVVPGSDGALVPTYSVLVERMECEDRSLPGGARIRVSGDSPLVSKDAGRGDQVDLVAQLAPVRAFHNAGLPDPLPWLASRGAVLSGGLLALSVVESGGGPLRQVDRARTWVRRRIVATYPPRAEGLARALVLGESDLDEGDSAAFRQSGLLHLLAVSGTHLVIAVLALVRGLRALLVRVPWLVRRVDVSRAPALVGCLLGVVYADFSGQSGSAVRAALMLLLVLGARASGRRLSGMSALGGSLGLGVLFRPLLGADVSFLLSALATLGLIVLGQPVSRWLRRGILAKPPLSPLVEGVVATVSATLFCAPLLSTMTSEMTPKAIVANLVAAPLGEVLALPACLLHATMGAFPEVERGLSVIGSWALLLVRRVAHVTVGAPGPQLQLMLPSSWNLAWLACAGLIVLRWLLGPMAASGSTRILRSRRSPLMLLLPLALGVAGGAPGRRDGAWPAGEPHLAVTALDVGQGDALLVDLPDGRVVLVDGGGFATAMPDTGRRVLLPALRARGKKAVDLMVVSHAHPDHIGGLLGVAAELPVRQLWHPEDPARTPSLRALTEKVRRRGGSIWGPKELCQADGPARRARRMGGVTFRVLHSCTEEATSTEPEMGLNDGSLVLRLQFGERSFLLTGDVEARGERRLTESFGDELAVDVLKIPHHGSDTSSGENFLELAQPRVAIISSGVRNRFAHPRASVLRRLRSRGIEIWRTDRSGSVSLVTDGSSLWMRTAQTTYSDKPDILSLWRPSIRRILPRSKS